MTDSTHNLFDRRPANLRSQTIGIGAFLVALLIVAALVLTAVKLASMPHEGLSLIPLDHPAAWSGFTA